MKRNILMGLGALAVVVMTQSPLMVTKVNAETQSNVTISEGITLDWYRQGEGKISSQFAMIRDNTTWAPAGLLSRVYNDIHYTVNTPNPKGVNNLTDSNHKIDIQGIEFLRVTAWAEANQLRVERERGSSGRQIITLSPTPESILSQPSSTRMSSEVMKPISTVKDKELLGSSLDGTTVMEWQLGSDLNLQDKVVLFKVDFNKEETLYAEIPKFSIRMDYTGMDIEHNPNNKDTEFLIRSNDLQIEAKSVKAGGLVYAKDLADKRALEVNTKTSEVISIGNTNFRGISYVDKNTQVVTQEMYRVVGNSVLTLKVSGSSLDGIKQVLEVNFEGLI
jgi:hypothetical protein